MAIMGLLLMIMEFIDIFKIKNNNEAKGYNFKAS